MCDTIGCEQPAIVTVAKDRVYDVCRDCSGELIALSGYEVLA